MSIPHPAFYSEMFYHPCNLKFELYACNYKCSYCFVNRKNNPTPHSYLNLILRSQYEQNSIVKYMLHKGYSVCLCNNTDPFCEDNIQWSEIIGDALLDNGNSIMWVTKGGDNDRILRQLEKNPSKQTLYCSIEYLNDDTRQKNNPHAPSIDSRRELLWEARALGCKTILAINPFCFEADIRDHLYKGVAESHPNVIITHLLKSISKELVKAPEKYPYKDYLNVLSHFDNIRDDIFKDFPIKRDAKIYTNLIPVHNVNFETDLNMKGIPSIGEVNKYAYDNGISVSGDNILEILQALRTYDMTELFNYPHFISGEFAAQNQTKIRFNECNGINTLGSLIKYVIKKYDIYKKI